MQEITDKEQWYCLRSQPKHEGIAAAHLRQIPEVAVFCPRLRFRRATQRGVMWFEEAMFPGYLFARFSFPKHYKEIRYSSGVSSILRFGDHYAVIEDAVVEGLRSVMNEKQVAVIDSEINQGDTVKIAEGAFCGLEAVVSQVLSGKDRVRLLTNFLGREIAVEVSKPGIVPLRRHPLAT